MNWINQELKIPDCIGLPVAIFTALCISFLITIVIVPPLIWFAIKCCGGYIRWWLG